MNSRQMLSAALYVFIAAALLAVLFDWDVAWVAVIAAGAVVVLAGVLESIMRWSPQSVLRPQLANAVFGLGLILSGVSMHQPSLGLARFAFAMILGAVVWSAWSQRKAVAARDWAAGR